MNPDGRIMSFLAKLGDMFILNIMYLVCCIPVVTIGAATTALYYNTLKMAENREAYVWKDFLKSFRQNFRQATIIWMIILVIGAVLVGDFLVMGGDRQSGAGLRDGYRGHRGGRVPDTDSGVCVPGACKV